MLFNKLVVTFIKICCFGIQIQNILFFFSPLDSESESELNTKEALEVLGEVGGGGRWLGNFQRKIPIRQKRAKKLCMGSQREKIEQVLFTIIVKSYF